MRSRAKLHHIVPLFKRINCFRKRKPDFRHELRKAILKDIDIKIPKSDAAIADEPFLMLGYGINAYFDIMISLSYMCLLITLFLVPVYFFYSQNSIKGLKDTKIQYVFNQFSLGNLGAASTLCTQKTISSASFSLTCPSG